MNTCQREVSGKYNAIKNEAASIADYLKPSRFIGDQTPLIVQEILELTEEENNDVSSEVEDDNVTFDESDIE